MNPQQQEEAEEKRDSDGDSSEIEETKTDRLAGPKLQNEKLRLFGNKGAPFLAACARNGIRRRRSNANVSHGVLDNLRQTSATMGIRCNQCNLLKLSEEFLDSDLTSSCSHFATSCLQCTFAHTEKEGDCLVCGSSVSEQEMQVLKDRLDGLSVAVPLSRSGTTGRFVYVTVMSGARFEIEFSPEMTVHDFKGRISQKSRYNVTKCRLIVKNSKDLLVRNRGSKQLLTLSDFDVHPGDVVHMIQFISNVAGKAPSELRGTVDRFGNVIGSEYDYGLDGGFVGLEIAVLQFYIGEGFDFSYPLGALEQKGFKVHRWTSRPPMQEFETVLERACQLWVISDSNLHLDSDFEERIGAFFRAGKGIFLWGDNDPYFQDANAIGKRFLSTTMDGNKTGDQSVSLKMEGGQSGFLQHDLSTGLTKLYEGITIATIRPGPNVKPLMYGSAGNLVTAYYDEQGCRCIFDGGFTRLFCKWDEAGQPRFVVNCAAWLANMEDLV